MSLRYVDDPRALGAPDLVILPGTKNTLDDLKWLRQNGLEAKLLQHAGAGGALLGICGGYQMLGETISDPEGVEGGGTLRGLGLLPGRTVFRGEKTRTQVEGTFTAASGIFAGMAGTAFTGYEIHMGETANPCPAMALRDQTGREKTDGQSQGNVLGCYIHGLFDRGECAKALVDCLLQARGLTAQTAAVDWNAYQETQFNLLSDGLRRAIDMQAVYRILGTK